MMASVLSVIIRLGKYIKYQMDALFLGIIFELLRTLLFCVVEEVILCD